MRTYPPCWVLKARIQKHRGKPLLFHDECPGFFYAHYTTHGTYRFTKQLWFISVLLKDTSAPTGQAGIRTHILTTPELESNALDRSATTQGFNDLQRMDLTFILLINITLRWFLILIGDFILWCLISLNLCSGSSLSLSASARHSDFRLTALV